jgi:hypothetical protein
LEFYGAAQPASGCGFGALVGSFPRLYIGTPVRGQRGNFMKKLVIATAAVIALLSVAGCAQTGKGKAPPPVVTKG